MFIEIRKGFFIEKGDCRDVLRKIDSNSIDCVITDPPYFLEGLDNNWDIKSLNNKKNKSKLVGSLPTGMRFNKNQGIRLQEFMEEVAAEIYRVLKPGGFFLCFSQGRLYHRMAIAIENKGFEIRDMYIWKRIGQAKAFSQNHFIRKMKISEDKKNELIKTLANRKTPQLKAESEPIVMAQKPKEGTFVENWVKWKVGLIDVSQSLDNKFPSTIMAVDKPKGEERNFNHMTIKPVKLMEHLIKIFTVENQVVLDPFMGSGTTAIACCEAKREFIGIEINKEYLDIAKNRIETYNNKE